MERQPGVVIEQNSKEEQISTLELNNARALADKQAEIIANGSTLRIEHSEYHKHIQETLHYLRVMGHFNLTQSITYTTPLIEDYLMQGTVARSSYLPQEATSKDIIADIDNDIALALEKDKVPFDFSRYREHSEKYHAYQTILKQAEENHSQAMHVEAEKTFYKKKEQVLLDISEQLQKYQSIYDRVVTARDRISHEITTHLKPYLDLGIAQDQAIEIYRKQEDSIYLDVHGLENFNSLIADIGELILELEIDYEKYNSKTFSPNMNSQDDFSASEPRKKLMLNIDLDLRYFPKEVRKEIGL